MRRRYISKFALEDFIIRLLFIVVVYFALSLFLKKQALINPQFANFQLSTPPIFFAFATVVFEAFLLLIVYYIYQRYRLSKAGIYEIDQMDGFQFEKKLCILFQQLGYSVDHYSESHRGNEYGVDLIIEKEGIRTAVQAKRFGRKQHVDNTAVEKLVAGKALVNCDQAMVVTNSTYTQNARYAAQKLNVKLWDRKELVNQLLKAKSTV